MKCPKCNFENRSGIKFCEECGADLGARCPNCGALLPLRPKFCGECGHSMSGARERRQPAKSVDERRQPFGIMGQRKLVTVLFSDLSGFTAMTEKMDSEEVKEIMDSIFGKIAQVITRYEGFIEKFIGDAVMAIFGAPKAHEDDAVRAVRTAREIHDLVQATGSKLKHKIGQVLAMHSGIDTGVVVTGEMDLQKRTLRFAGDTINRAARLCNIAKSGEILVGAETYLAAEAHFHFEKCESALVKGKSEPIAFYRVLSSKTPTSWTHRAKGLQAELVGRSLELAQLGEAKQRLAENKGTIVSICGDAGTGKSRLVEEFKATLEPEKYHWLEAHAYAYTQNIPYWPLMDALNRNWQIEEEDSLEEVRDKIERGVQQMLGKHTWVSSSIASLYGVSHPLVEEMSPEIWKSQLYEAVHLLLAARTRSMPTVILLEDLHWADSSSLELLRFIISEMRSPALFLGVYRAPFSLFTTHQLNTLGWSYREIRLEALSPSEAQAMTESLLGTKNVPFELRRFIQEMAGGNPFYLEEVIHSLMESEVLVYDSGIWKCTRPLSESGIRPTIQGVIAARLDHVNMEERRILQEASVIGRAFLFPILESVTAFKGKLDQSLSDLERMDLIRTRSVQPDVEYVFKHALTHEVVYNGLLKKERKAVHERIGMVMENLFHDRLPEFYETLAFHFKQGKSMDRAVDYLVKSGEKSLRRYAVDESHQYFQEAFNLLDREVAKNGELKSVLIDVLIKWASVHYYSGHYAKLLDRLEAYKPLADSLTDLSKRGMFYAWLGWAMWHRERFQGAQQFLLEALKLGEEVGDLHVVGCACSWLTWTCADLGLLDEAESYAGRAQGIAAQLMDSEHDMYFSSLAGLGYVHWHKGESRKSFEIGKTLVEFGQSHFNVRSVVWGHSCIAFSHFVTGDYSAAKSSFQEAVKVSIDPWYSQFPRMGACYASALAGQFQDLEEPLRQIMAFGLERGAEYVSSATQLLLGVTLVANGKMQEGMELIDAMLKWWLEKGSKTRYVQSLYVAGMVYAQIFQVGMSGPSDSLKLPGSASEIITFAEQKALECLNTAAEIAKAIGSRGHLSKCCLSLGLLYKAKGEDELAKKFLVQALELFRGCEADTYAKEAEKALDSMESPGRP